MRQTKQKYQELAHTLTQLLSQKYTAGKRRWNTYALTKSSLDFVDEYFSLEELPTPKRAIKNGAAQAKETYSILDQGCGAGRTLLEMVRLAEQYTKHSVLGTGLTDNLHSATEYLDTQLRRQTPTKKHSVPHAEYITENGTPLVILEDDIHLVNTHHQRSYDFVLAHWVYVHLALPTLAIDQTIRTLKSGGSFFSYPQTIVALEQWQGASGTTEERSPAGLVIQRTNERYSPHAPLQIQHDRPYNSKKDSPLYEISFENASRLLHEHDALAQKNKQRNTLLAAR